MKSQRDLPFSLPNVEEGEKHESSVGVEYLVCPVVAACVACRVERELAHRLGRALTVVPHE